MNNVEKDWLEFRDAVVPLDASEGQVNAMKMAFFSGGYATFNLITTTGGLTLEGAIEKVEKIEQEFYNFIADLDSKSTAMEEKLDGDKITEH
tara:strand:- start:1576 stop:1851 length:276 start_codon:yes stop_codon:yes gene_type:complete